MVPVENAILSANPINLRPTYLEVDLDALTHNVSSIRKVAPKSKMMAILKANAYGHGLLVCGKHFESSGVDFLGVAFLEEGIALRQAGVKIPILVLGGISSSQIDYFLDYDLDLLASSVSKLQAIDRAAKAHGVKARVHLKIDTGMERIGVHYYNAETLLAESLKASNCEIVGISTHFVSAQLEDNSLAKLQLERFLEVTSFFEKNSLPMPIRHVANSAGTISFPEAQLEMVRPGIVLYGVYPAEHLRDKISLKAVAKLRSEVAYFKVVKKGAGVGYDHTWIASCDTRVVTVPVGYGDGYFRCLSNKSSVLIRGKRYPVVGRVCMDQIMVNIGDGEAYGGDEVVLLGSQGEETITANEIAAWAGTNSHEVLVAMSLRIPRRYKKGTEVFFES